MQIQLGASKAETADFERDPNQQSLMMSDLKAPAAGQEAGAAPKEKRFLLNELKQIKEQLYQKLFVYKARSAGQRAPKVTVESGQFEILDHFGVEDILRKEIDHFFIMTQVLNTIVLRGDETMRTMQELAKLTND